MIGESQAESQSWEPSQEARAERAESDLNNTM